MSTSLIQTAEGRNTARCLCSICKERNMFLRRESQVAEHMHAIGATA